MSRNAGKAPSCFHHGAECCNTSALFPLTPALSLRERGNYGQHLRETGTLGNAGRLAACLPLPEGEGRGEGESDTRPTSAVDLSRRSCRRAGSARSLTGFLCVGILAYGLAAATAFADEQPSVQNRGQAIVRKFAEVNRYWLIGPPQTVRQFSYTLYRPGKEQDFAVPDPMKAPRARRTGMTYSTMLHQLAAKPESATVRSIAEEGERMRLTLAFDPPVRGACGNGVENSWSGYFNLGGDAGYLILDAARLVPLEAGMGNLTETFAEFAEVDAAHFVPLAIAVQKDGMRFDWRFRLYEPGLWLLDDSRYGERRVAWIDQVKVNKDTPVLLRAVEASAAREKAEAVGAQALQTFLEANRRWLLPSLEARRGLFYEYRQEAPYLERVLFDPEGNLMARLEAAKENPERPTRQRLWLADGRSYSGDAGDQFVKLEGAANAAASPDAWLQRDRLVQHVAMGLALDCALTRLAREPDTFWAEVLPVSKAADRYLLVLHARKDARLFTGTMLTFSSWSFMHDVRYDRSEILCDAVTHRPLQEKDYAGKSDLKGEYHFEGWLSDPSGAAPGRIRAAIPNAKDGKDQALDMDARFRFAKPGVWLLERAESSFRGGGGGSTGTVAVVSVTAESFQPISDLLEKAKATAQVLGAIQEAPTGSTAQPIKPGGWSSLPLQARWSAEARERAEFDREGERMPATKPLPLIGLHRARIIQAEDGSTGIELEGLSTASWKEFETEWMVKLQDAEGRLLAARNTNLVVRAESPPAPFRIQFSLPSSDAQAPVKPERVAVEASVQRMTGAYHGHGVWFRFARKE
jgi:hypothetical protein